MCKVCAIAARYQRASNEGSLVFNLSQFSTVLDVKQASELTSDRSPTPDSEIAIQEKLS